MFVTILQPEWASRLFNSFRHRISFGALKNNNKIRPTFRKNSKFNGNFSHMEGLSPVRLNKRFRMLKFVCGVGTKGWEWTACCNKRWTLVKLIEWRAKILCQRDNQPTTKTWYHSSHCLSVLYFWLVLGFFCAKRRIKVSDIGFH